MPDLESIGILLIEDNPGDVSLVVGALQMLDPTGFTVAHAETVGAGLEQLKAKPFDLVLLDLHLPDSHGAETFANVMAKAGDVPIVVLSSADDESLAINAIASGVQDYLVKGSINERTLGRSIRYARERKRLEVELQRANAMLEQRVRERTADLERSVVVLGEEVAENQLASKKLEEMQQQFHDMLNAMPLAIWLTSADGRRNILCNSRYEQLTGWSPSPEGMETATWLETIDPEDRQRVADEFATWLEEAKHGSRASLELIFGITHRDGTIRRFISRNFGVYDPDGTLRYICGLAEEIKDSATAASDSQVIIVNSDGLITHWEAQAATGIPRREAIGKTLTEAFESFSHESRWSRLKHALRK